MKSKTTGSERPVQKSLRSYKTKARESIDEFKELRREHMTLMREMRKAHKLAKREQRREHIRELKEISRRHSAAVREMTAKIRESNKEGLESVKRRFTKVIDWRNIGKKPDHSKLARKGYFVADLHMHSVYSDGVMNIPMILERGKMLGLNIAVTDHDEIKGSLEALNNREDVNVLPGLEVTSKEGKHFLFYFLDENEMKRFFKKDIRGKLYRPTAELMELRKKYDTVLVWAHPKGIYPWQNHKRDFNVRRLDGMEAYNSWGASKQIRDVYNWAKKTNCFSIGSSDAHLPEDIGRVVTYARARTFKTFFQRLKERQAKIAGKDARRSRLIFKYPVKYFFQRRSLMNQH